MTAITDAKAVVELLLGKTTTAEQNQRIANGFVARDPYSLWNPADPQNPTGEEKAQLFLDTMLAFGKQTIRNGAEFTAAETAKADIAAAGDTAVTDLE